MITTFIAIKCSNKIVIYLEHTVPAYGTSRIPHLGLQSGGGGFNEQSLNLTYRLFHLYKIDKFNHYMDVNMFASPCILHSTRRANAILVGHQAGAPFQGHNRYLHRFD